MILVDTSVWIDHLRSGDPRLADLLRAGEVLCHPWLIGELALGHLHRRHEVLELLSNLGSTTLATHSEVMALIETRRLFGRGIAYVDVHVLASTLLTAGVRLWTGDRRLAAVANELGIAAPLA